MNTIAQNGNRNSSGRRVSLTKAGKTSYTTSHKRGSNVLRMTHGWDIFFQDHHLLSSMTTRTVWPKLWPFSCKLKMTHHVGLPINRSLASKALKVNTMYTCQMGPFLPFLYTIHIWQFSIQSSCSLLCIVHFANGGCSDDVGWLH